MEILFVWNGIKIVLISKDGCGETTVCREKVKLYSGERIQINLNYFRQVNAQKYRWKEAN